METTATVFLIGNTSEVREDFPLFFNAHGMSVAKFDSIQDFLAANHPDQVGCTVLDVDSTSCRYASEVQSGLKELGVEIPVIFIASKPETAMIVKAIRLGAYDFMAKSTDQRMLLGKVKSAMKLNWEQREATRKKDAMLARIALLTERERKILALAMSGRSNKEVSQILGISHRTVETHRSHILVKLDIGNLLELAHAFIELEYSLLPQEALTPAPVGQ